MPQQRGNPVKSGRKHTAAHGQQAHHAGEWKAQCRRATVSDGDQLLGAACRVVGEVVRTDAGAQLPDAVRALQNKLKVSLISMALDPAGRSPLGLLVDFPGQTPCAAATRRVDAAAGQR